MGQRCASRMRFPVLRATSLLMPSEGWPQLDSSHRTIQFYELGRIMIEGLISALYSSFWCICVIFIGIKISRHWPEQQYYTLFDKKKQPLLTHAGMFCRVKFSSQRLANTKALNNVNKIKIWSKII